MLQTYTRHPIYLPSKNFLHLTILRYSPDKVQGQFRKIKGHIKVTDLNIGFTQVNIALITSILLLFLCLLVS